MDPEQKLPTEETQEDGLNQQVSDLNLNSNGNENENGNGVTVDQGGDVQPTAAEFSMMRKVLRNKLLHHTQNKVEILQKDPNNPLYSVKSFDELNIPEPLLRGIYDMGFSKPSRIQEAALPILLHTPPTNLIAQSQSGTGKTAAFLLASLYRVKPEVKEPQVIILAPTYELALQTGEVAQQMAKYRPEITIKYVIRGEVLPRGTKLQDHILIGTPGKMIDWSLKYQFFDIKKIRVFVLDEADVMIDTQGLRAQSVKMKQFLPESCQMMLFSATYSDEVMEFARSIIREPVLILKLRVEEQSLDNINQYYIDVSNEQEKYEALTNIFGTISMGQAFIFVETKISASRLVQQLRKDEHSVGLISGDLTVEQRNEALKRFREGQERVIVATNVMARGIDIEQVSLVINYDLPINVETREVDCETYLHRIGRTGRFGKEGLAINFVDGYRSRAMIQVLEEHFGKPIKKLDATDVDEIEKIGNDM
ncbi:ATP-dependent RNA helicase ddx25 [Tyrophagus putrescentiae]|nr:ATP-dependent RNA helicase ddx25 [Tyrophagus putrescentiae]